MNTLKDSTVTSLNDYIEYSTGSVISKTLIKKKAGTVTLFSFDKGESLSTHSASFDALVQVLEGKVEITIDGKPYLVGKDESILLPANVPHGLVAREKFKMLLTMIKEV